MSRITDEINAAVRHFARFGYLDPATVDQWTDRIEAAADDPDALERAVSRATRVLTGAFERVLRRNVLRGRRHPVPAWPGLAEPAMRDELERRIYAAVDLIKLNRENAIAKTLARFRGFATSVPPGGTPQVDRRKVAHEIAQPSKTLDFIARRCQIDQTGKLFGSLHDIEAKAGGAIGGVWDNNPQLIRRFRPDHVERHRLFYPYRGSQAVEQGLIRHPHGFVEDHELPGQLIYCQCAYEYIYDLADVPPDMLTPKGRASLEQE